MEVPANLRAQQDLVVYVSNTAMALTVKTVLQVNKMQGRHCILGKLIFPVFYIMRFSFLFSSAIFKFESGYPILTLFDKGGEMEYKGPKDLASLEFFVLDELITKTRKVSSQETN